MQIPAESGAAPQLSAPDGAGAASATPATWTGTGPAPAAARAGGLGGRFAGVRHGQALLDTETRLRRMLVALLLVQVVLWIVLALTGAYVGLLMAIVGAGVLAAAMVIFGPADADAAGAAGTAGLEAVLRGQRAEIDELHARAAAAEAQSALQAELARRQTSLLLRQLGRIDELEARETDPVALGELFGLDHLATRMRRCAEGVLVLTGEPGAAPAAAGPSVAVSEVLRGAVAEIEDFRRVDVTLDRDATLVGTAISDVVHLLAELIENATVFSSPATRVHVHGRAVPAGYVVTITDAGVGVDPVRAKEIDALLSADRPALRPGALGYQVVARLAARQGIVVGVAPAAAGGTVVAVALPPRIVEGGPGIGAVGEDPVGGSSHDESPDASFWHEPLAGLEPGTVYQPLPVGGGHAADRRLDRHSDRDLDRDPAPAAAPLDPDDQHYELAWEVAAAAGPAPAVARPAPPAVEHAPFIPPVVLVPPSPAGAAPASIESPVRYPPPEPPASALPDPPATAPPAPPASALPDPPATAPPAPPASALPDPPASVPPDSAAAGVTDAGLQRRVPLANMSPRLAGAGESPATPDGPPGPASHRSGWLLSAYRDGLVLGRDGQAVAGPDLRLEDELVGDAPLDGERAPDEDAAAAGGIGPAGDGDAAYGVR